MKHAILIALTILTYSLPAQTGDRYHWVVTTYQAKIKAIPVVGTLKSDSSKQVRKYRRWFRENPTNYFVLEDYPGYSMAVWVSKDKVIFTKKQD